MNQYWWENINKTTKSTLFATRIQNTMLGNLSTPPQNFKLPNRPFEVWQRISYSFPHLMDINMFWQWLYIFSLN